MIRRLCTLLAPSLLAGCISLPTYVPLAPEARSSLGDVRATSLIVQDEVIVVAQNPGVSRAMGGGLIAAVIDSNIAKGRQSEIQARIEPFYESVDDIDFRKEFWSAVVPYLKGSYPVKIGEVRTTALGITRAELDKIKESLAPGTGFMLVGTSYRFTPDYSQLNIATAVNIWRAGQKDPAYSNIFTYQSRAVSIEDGDPLRQWGADAGKRYREAIGEGVAEVVKMMRLDMQYPRLADGQQAAGFNTVSLQHVNALGAKAELSGPALEEQPRRVIVRNQQGRLFSLPR